MTRADLGVRGVAVGAEDEEVAARSVGVRQDVVYLEEFVCGGQAALVTCNDMYMYYIEYMYIHIYIYALYTWRISCAAVRRHERKDSPPSTDSVTSAVGPWLLAARISEPCDK